MFADLLQAVTEAAQKGAQLFYFGGATGFDILAAEAVLCAKKQGCPVALRAALPYKGFGRHFPPLWRVRQQACLRGCEKIVHVSAPEPGSYFRRNQYMVERSGLLICYYTGQPGGTRHTYQTAKRAGVSIQNLFGQMALLL